VSRDGDPVRILGVDPGSRHTGYGLIEKQQSRLVYLESGSISPDAKESFARRLAAMHTGLAERIAAFQPHHVAMEDIFHAANVRSALQLAHVRGVLVLAAAQAGLEIAAYAPRVIKKAVVGTGGADKAQVAWMIERLLSLAGDKRRTDITDALAAAVCHASHLGSGERQTTPRLEHGATGTVSGAPGDRS
jgi:crossover junction endodeoxyribonuclease RuvC